MTDWKERAKQAEARVAKLERGIVYIEWQYKTPCPWCGGSYSARHGSVESHKQHCWLREMGLAGKKWGVQNGHDKQ